MQFMQNKKKMKAMGGGTKYFNDGLTKGVKWRDERECNPPKPRTSIPRRVG